MFLEKRQKKEVMSADFRDGLFLFLSTGREVRGKDFLEGVKASIP